MFTKILRSNIHYKPPFVYLDTLRSNDDDSDSEKEVEKLVDYETFEIEAGDAAKEELPKESATERKRKFCSINGLKWILFYTDVQHRVEPVLSGTRMVLQFDVLITFRRSPFRRGT